jgi:hypothetical protein
VIGSAVIPTVIANAFFLPYYLLPKSRPWEGGEQQTESATAAEPLVGQGVARGGDLG